MRLLHSAARTSAAFDAENVVSLAGLVPVMRLAQEAGLPELVAERVRLGTSIGGNPAGEDRRGRGRDGRRGGLDR
jgi:hypothetical protein